MVRPWSLCWCAPTKDHQQFSETRSCAQHNVRARNLNPASPSLSSTHTTSELTKTRFIEQPRAEINAQHTRQKQSLTDDITSLDKKAKYFAKQVEEANGQLRDIVSGAPGDRAVASCLICVRLSAACAACAGSCLLFLRPRPRLRLRRNDRC